MSTLKLVRIPEPMIDSSSVDSKYQPDEIRLPPFKNNLIIGRNNAHHRPDYCIESALNNRMISRKHTTLEHTIQGYKLQDHSLNGTYVNYCRPMGSVYLLPGDIVTFGHLNGANIKPGEKIPEYNSDLKYRVEILEAVSSTSNNNNSHHHHSTSTTSSTTTSTTTAATTTQGRKRLSSSKDDHHHHTPISSSKVFKKRDNSSSSASTTTTATSGGAGGLKRKNVSGTGGGSTLPKMKSAISSSGVSSGGGGSSLLSSTTLAGGGVGAGVGDNMYHYENDQCNAKPCLKPEDVNIHWIQCDLCNAWYHQICVGISDADEVDENETYACPYCRRK